MVSASSSSSHTSPLPTNNTEAHMNNGGVQRVTPAASKTFKQIVSVKLDDTNYLQWKQQVEGVLRGTKMVRYVVSPQIPPVFLSDAAREAGDENPAFTEWEEQDSTQCGKKTSEGFKFSTPISLHRLDGMIVL